MKAFRLLVVAHPDDESIFFAGAIQSLRGLPWHVICVTDGNADGRGAERAQEFKSATKLLGVKTTEHWTYADKFPGRLPVNELAEKLRKLNPKEIYTHGPLGEYGHPHHQDVCLAVHRAFPKKKIFSPAWNCAVEKVVKLTPAQFKKKTKAYAEIYKKETAHIVATLPNMPVEFFRSHSTKEVEAIVGYLRKERELSAKELDSLAWLASLLPGLREKLEVRL